MEMSVSKNKHLIELNNGELVDINEVAAKLSKIQNLESDLYEANNRIADLMNIIDERDKIIDLMVNAIYKMDCESEYGNSKGKIKKYFEKRCKDAKD